MTREEAKAKYAELLTKYGYKSKIAAELGRNDLFFLLVYILGIKAADNDWCFERCREVQVAPNGYLDLWPREHFKTTIITIGLTIQDILRNPDVTVGIFSFNRTAAKACLRGIKWHFESNERLKVLYPEVCYDDPAAQSPKWNEDEGIIVRRKSLVKEATVEAWGLIDSMPTGKHYQVRVYDDVVTRESVSTPEMTKKVNEAFDLSMNLGSSVDGIDIRRAVGTRYGYYDTYRYLLDKGVFKERLYTVTKDNTVDGEPWLWTKELLDEKIRSMGPYVSACQLFNRPVLDDEQVFRAEDLRYWVPDRKNWVGKLNVYIVVDPAHSKKKYSDYTVMWVVGVGEDGNYYVIDCVRDRLSPVEKVDTLFELVKTYRPLRVGYEKYGMQSDIDMIRVEMQRKMYYFDIVALGGNIAKVDRIKLLQPLFAQHRIYLPEKIHRIDSSGKLRDYIQEFITEEYCAFPYTKHDDMLDCLARITDNELGVVFPYFAGGVSMSGEEKDVLVEEYDYEVYT